MPITLQNLPGLMDVPKTALATGSTAADWLLEKIHSNSDFSLVAYETFYTELQDGQSLRLPVKSPVDGYIYSDAELFWLGALRLSANGSTGRTSGGGNIHLISQGIDAEGKASSLVSYYVQSGAQTDTKDGLIATWIVAVRNRTLATFSAQPQWSALADSVFAVDAALSQTKLQKLSENAKFACVRFEAFHNAAAKISSLVRSNAGGLAGVTLTFAGSGYLVGDILSVAQGSATGGKIQVTAVNAPVGQSGAITGIQIFAAGSGYINQGSPGYTAPTLSGGHGFGAALAITGTGGGCTLTFARPHSFLAGDSIVIAQVENITGSSGRASDFEGVWGPVTVVSATQVSVPMPGLNAVADSGFAYKAFGFKNGDTVPLPISFVDGYAYSRSECAYFPFLIYSGASVPAGTVVKGLITPQIGLIGPSGAGNIQRIQVSVNPSTGVVSSTITYWDGSNQTVTNDGLVGVLVLCQRTMPAFTPAASAFVDLPAEAFFADADLISYNLQTLNDDIKFGALRHEVFVGTYGNGNTVPLPVSPVDGYAYQRTELQYLWSIADTGLPAQAGGATTDALLEWNNFVDPSTGIVTSQVATYRPGANQTNTTNGSLTVVTLARRSHQNVDRVVTPSNAISQLSGSLLDPIQLNADPSDPVITDVFINKEEGIVDWAWSGTAHSFDVQLDESGTATFKLNAIELDRDPDRFVSLNDFVLAHPFDFRVRPYRVNTPGAWFQIHYAGTTPGNVVNPQVSETTLIIDGHREVALTFSWTEPTDGDYSGVAIYVFGYQGVNLWVRHWAKSKGTTNFVSTDLLKTGETVKFAFVSFDRGGFENPISTSPQVLNVVLNGNDTAPNSPTGLTVTPQLGALLLTWTANTDPDIGGYEVWRDDTDLTSTPPTNFAKISTLKADLSGAGTVTYVDPVGSNVSKRYALRAYNTHGTLSLYPTAVNGTSLFNIPDADNEVRNSRFQDWAHSTDQTALYWSIGQNIGATFKQTTTPPSGSVGQEIDIAINGSGTLISSKFACRPRAFYVVGQEIWVQSNVTTSGPRNFRVYFYDQNGNGSAYIDFVPGAVASGSGYQKNNIWLLTPQSGDTKVGTAYGILNIVNTLNYDPKFMAIETGQTAVSAAQVLKFGRVVGAEAKDVNNNVPLNAPATNNAVFTVTSTVISWGAFSIFLGGDSQQSNAFSVSAGSISGLTPGATYILYYDMTPATAGVYQTQSLQSIQKSQFVTLGIVVTALSTPAAPTLASVALANAPGVTYFVKVQYQEFGPNVNSPLSAESSLAVTAGNTVQVSSPAASTNAAYYAIWLSTTSGSEVLVATLIPLGTAYTWLPFAIGGSGAPPAGPGSGSPPSGGGAQGGGGSNGIGGGTESGGNPAGGGRRLE